MVHKYAQALLSSEGAEGSEPAADARRWTSIFSGRWNKLALLLGSSCLVGMAYAAFLICMPKIAQKSNLTKLHEHAKIYSDTPFDKYYWPSAHGPIGSYTKSPYPANLDITNPTRTWHYHCCFMCTWCTINTGTSIDDKKNIYLTSQDGIRKFSSHGKLLWHYRPRKDVIKKTLVLMDGVAYTFTLNATALAISMDTGKLLWSTKVADGADLNDGQTAVNLGVFIVAAEAITSPDIPGLGSKHVYGLNSTDGSQLWLFTPDAPIWNFGVSFDNDGTFFYMDVWGQVYRNSVKDGTLLWKAGGFPHSWSDGQANLGSNGVVYAPANPTGCKAPCWEGVLTAYRLSDGEILWRRNSSRPPNSVPAVGMLAGQSKLSVVMPVGRQSVQGEDIGVYALDAETGEEQWWFQGPIQTALLGDPADTNPTAISQRLFNNIYPITMPNPWGIPAIDGEGNVFVGGITGHFFRLQDSDGDGKVAGPREVAKLTTDAGFCGASGPAIAPGLLALGNSHSMFIWDY